jgi:predicted RNase H-like HicB family nuclease
MVRYFTLEYWFDDDWYVGRLKEVPGVFGQGETLQELEANIEEAYRLMLEAEEPDPRPGVQTKAIGLEV